MQALFLFTICCCVWPSFEKLAGDHICQMQISEPVETLVWTIKNRTLRTFQWCLNVPPRCSSYSNVQVNETQTLVNYVNKTVERCCDGYYEREGECADEACKGCRNGYCSNGYCDCKPGWMGSSCDRPCMTDQRGSNCTNQCNCWKYIQCVAENKAECDCVSGWLPDSCELTCPKPYYGTKCVHLCTCNILTQTCTIEKGKCVIKEKKSKDVIDYQGENAESTTVTDDSADVRTTLTSRSPFQITVLFTNQSGSTNNLSNTDHFLVTHQPQKEISSRNLFLGIASLSVITVVVTATVIGLLALKLIRRKADKGCPDKNATAVAVYTTSIFHTPLPGSLIMDLRKLHSEIDQYEQMSISRPLLPHSIFGRTLRYMGVVRRRSAAVVRLDRSLLYGLIELSQDNNFFHPNYSYILYGYVIHTMFCTGRLAFDTFVTAKFMQLLLLVTIAFLCFFTNFIPHLEFIGELFAMIIIDTNEKKNNSCDGPCSGFLKRILYLVIGCKMTFNMKKSLNLQYGILKSKIC